MSKTWNCTQCGNGVTKDLIGSIRGAPETCEHCGNTEFEEPTTLGRVHTLLDRLTG